MTSPQVRLHGMTWNHPRGVDPLVAHAREYQARHGVAINWDARSLEDFEAFSLNELAGKYDLLVIDHPHVGMAAKSGCLQPFDNPPRLDTVGRSNESYHFAGKQWALAIDAAAQVSVRRAGSLDHWPRDWEEVLALAHAGRILWPLAPVHALMCFFTLCANARHPCADGGPKLIDDAVARQVLLRLRDFATFLPRACFDMNPIGVYERMVTDERFVYCPLMYGYVSYAREGFRETRLEFGDIPGVRGSTLGGTGIAVSASSKHRDDAVAVAVDLASPAVQRGLYAWSGGQPAHREAWTDDAVNAATHNFYRDTLATLDAAYIRPRFDGYLGFQQSAGEMIANCIRGDAPIACTITQVNELFATVQGLQSSGMA